MTSQQEYEKYLDLMNKELEAERLRRMSVENEAGNMSAFASKQEQNLVEYQLDLKEELDRIYHLLSGHIIVYDENEGESWQEPTDDRMKIFSDYGVKQIMNIISFYVNRNTLMSYYDEQTIIWKVKDFGIELSDLIFNKYEDFFHYPSPEELYEKYLPVVEKQGLNISPDELYQKCIQWSKIELQSKLRHYPMIVKSLIDTVHSTYLRALGGKERQSLRERMNISQNANQFGDNQPVIQKKKLFKPSTW